MEDDDHNIVARLQKSEKEKQEILRKNEEEKRVVADQIRERNEEVDLMKRHCVYIENKMKKSNEEKELAVKAVNDLNGQLYKQMQMAKDGVVADFVVQLERENLEMRHENAELKKKTETVESTLEENIPLKNRWRN